MDHVLGVHVDSNNPNIHDSLYDSFINQPVGCFAQKKRDQICRLLIGFCRNMSGHVLMGRPSARLETMALVIHLYFLV